MQSNAPAGYECPICLGVRGEERDDPFLKKSDIVYQDELITVFINSFFIESCEGHVIVVPNKHFENIYDIKPEYGHRIFDISQKVAIAMKKAYSCDGITTRQNSEPAGDQHAFHYHFHVFPRYKGDLYNSVGPEKKRLTTPEERIPFAEKLKRELG